MLTNNNNPMSHRFAQGIVVFALAFAPAAFVSAASVSIDSISPSSTVPAATQMSFHILASGFVAQHYQLSDSLSGSTAAISNIDNAGTFTWTPTAKDVGQHVFTITAADFYGASATITQTITVSPAPSIVITNVAPGSSIMPGKTLTFTASAPGFTNPRFIVGDSFSGSSITDANIDSSGNFSWKVDMTQLGTHAITVYGTDADGHGANTTQTVLVGAPANVSATALAPGATVSPGQVVSFTVNASNYSPSTFAVVDAFPHSTITSSNTNSATGQFSWMPQASDFGIHALTLSGTVGVYGQTATSSQTITVLGPGGIAPTAPAPATPTVSPPATVAAAATASSSLDVLLAQVAQLQSKIASQSGASASAASVSSGIVFSLHLAQGDDGTEVTQLQTVLAQQGLFSGTPSGHFGPLTAAAVKAFQTAHGLSPLGVVGPATRAALNALAGGTAASTQTASVATSNSSSTAGSNSGDGYVFNNFIGPGDSGTDVLELQKRLVALGLLTAQPTGYFGPATEAAVKEFQATNSLDTKGYVGIGTRAALNK